MRELAGRVAVVTGAASGIGLALAKRAAREGMRVVLADIEEAALASALAEVRAQAPSVEAIAVRTDVSKAESVEALAQAALQAYGKVHLLFNNAGVGGVRLKAWEASTADWQWVLGVNVWGVIHGVRVFTPILLAQGEEGHIVNTASVAGFLAMGSTAPYALSKHAVVALSEVLYHDLCEVSAQVRASVLCPAWVPTNIWNAQRNRPQELRERPESEAERATREQVRVLLEKGKVTADDVAGLSFDAVREQRFYVLPHPRILKDVRTRMEDILALRNPTRTA